MLELTQKLAFTNALEKYKAVAKNYNETIEKNIAVKWLYWIATYMPFLYGKKENTIPKVLYVGEIKRQELFFLYYLNLMGCDVLYMNPKQDIVSKYPESNSFSNLYKGSYQFDLEVPRQLEIIYEEPNKQSNCHATNEEKRVIASEVTKSIRRELSYEELAQLSTSVVMIITKNSSGECLAVGSGVVINDSGYILTNLHVIEKGSRFDVMFENEEQVYETNRIVKYHQDYDLALIKVEKTCTKLPLYRGEKIVRGQKVVAIGSPLGLFNSVSDGIISGFRTFEYMEMIQFTAPTSHGSSGGALLNMCGELIGICEGGYDDGQNLGLAVDYKTIERFAGNYFV